MRYHEPAQTFPLIVHAHGHPHVCWLTSLLIPIYHALSRHQDATLAKQCSAAGQDPECWLLRVPLLDKHGSSRRPDSAGGNRRRADVDGYMPRPLGFCEVVRTEIVEFATNCEGKKKSKILLKKYLCQEWKRSPCQFCILHSQCDALSPRSSYNISGIDGDMCSQQWQNYSLKSLEENSTFGMFVWHGSF